MLVDDYRPMRRLGVEEMQGLVSMFERRIDERPEGEPTASDWMDEGAWLALHLLLVSRFEYPQDFVDVYDEKKRMHFGGGHD